MSYTLRFVFISISWDTIRRHLSYNVSVIYELLHYGFDIYHNYLWIAIFLIIIATIFANKKQIWNLSALSLFYKLLELWPDRASDKNHFVFFLISCV